MNSFHEVQDRLVITGHFLLHCSPQSLKVVLGLSLELSSLPFDVLQETLVLLDEHANFFLVNAAVDERCILEC